MQTEPSVTPSPEDIYRVWRTDHRLRSGSAVVYCRESSYSVLIVSNRLGGARRAYPRTREPLYRLVCKRRNLDPRSLGLFRSALQSLNRVYHR